jgi:ABC-type phosphate transport system substrate-binding protein
MLNIFSFSACTVRSTSMAALLMLALPVRPVAAADAIYVIVSSQSPVRTLAQKDVLALYTGRTRTVPGGDAATPIDQDRNGPVRADFYQALTGMDIARINSYWARLHFTGQVQPPQAVGDDGAVIQRVRTDPGAVGYVVHEPQNPAVRVVLRLP